MPVPFNKNSMEIAFGEEKAAHYIEKLIDTFGDERKVTINELREQDDPELAEIADFVYKNVFLYYTQKQWGLTPEEVDPSVTARVPVFISRDNRYFQDAYQGMPVFGYTKLFENMLDHENIQVCLNTEAESVFELEFESEAEDAPLSAIKLHGKKFEGPIVYTGPLDELFLARFGRLPYRSLDFVYETFDKEHVLPCGTVNFTVTEDYTRITEFKYLTGQKSDKTTIMKEYSRAYEDPNTQTPYYAILSDENRAHYERYRALTAKLPNFYPLGRLAEYRYYNMDKIISLALRRIFPTRVVAGSFRRPSRSRCRATTPPPTWTNASSRFWPAVTTSRSSSSTTARQDDTPRRLMLGRRPTRASFVPSIRKTGGTVLP